MSLIVLASYPKSGNTWLRALLSNYFSGLDTPVPLNSLAGGYAFSHGRFLEETGLDTSLLSRAQQDQWRPAIARALAMAGPRVFVKAHEAFQCLPSGEPHFPPDAVSRVIYAVRDPRDVAMAFSYHLNRSAQATVTRMNAARGAIFSDNMLVERMGSWTGHVASWLDQDHLPVTLVRYEDLLTDPIETFSRVIAAIDETPDPKRIALSVHFSSIDSLRKQERETGFREMNPKAKSFFARRANRDEDKLPPDEDARLQACHKAMMQRLGYLA